MKNAGTKTRRASAAIATADEKRNARRAVKAYNVQGDNVHVSLTLSRKMDGIPAISTDVTCNPICRKRACAGDDRMTCSHCYACRIMSQYDAAAAHSIRNFEILTTRLLSDIECFKITCTMRGKNDVARIEATGDVYNVTQARNYLRVIKAGAAVGLHFGLWTKNPGVYAAAIRHEGRPENMTFILSSLYVDRVDAAGACKYDFIDAVFTVYSTVENYNAAVDAGAVACKCDTGSCDRCRQCYSYRRPAGAALMNIAELLR